MSTKANQPKKEYTVVHGRLHVGHETDENEDGSKSRGEPIYAGKGDKVLLTEREAAPALAAGTVRNGKNRKG